MMANYYGLFTSLCNIGVENGHSVVCEITRLFRDGDHCDLEAPSEVGFVQGTRPQHRNRALVVVDVRTDGQRGRLGRL